MAARMIQVFFVFFAITIGSSMFIGAETSDGVEKKTVKEFDVPTRCQKNTFLATNLKAGKELSPVELKQLTECGKYYPSCSQAINEIKALYAEDSDGKNVIIFQVTDISKQGCWGHMLQVTDDLGTKTIYFNFDKEDKDFVKYVYFRLGFKYNFTVTSLPSGKSLSLVTSAPNGCELDVMEHIYYKLQSQKHFFKNCEMPSYSARKEVAARICKKYPRNGAKRYKVTQNLLVEENCKFVLLPANFVNARMNTQN